MSTIENNKLIAEFLGWHGKKINITASRPKGDGIELYLKEVTEYNGRLIEESLQFHTDWNWLMQVVEKIENSKYVDEFVIKKCSVFGFNVLITPISYDTFNFFHCTLKDETKIQTVYNACLLFIEWYNNENSK